MVTTDGGETYPLPSLATPVSQDASASHLVGIVLSGTVDGDRPRPVAAVSVCGSGSQEQGKKHKVTHTNPFVKNQTNTVLVVLFGSRLPIGYPLGFSCIPAVGSAKIEPVRVVSQQPTGLGPHLLGYPLQPATVWSGKPKQEVMGV
jgi:hypothetical protein